MLNTSKKNLLKKLACLYLISGAAFAADIQEKYFPVEDPNPGNWFLNSIRKTRPLREKNYLEKLKKISPDEQERARLAEEFHHTLESNFFASCRREDEAIERALNWKRGDFTWHNNKFYSRPGCTSWIITPELSATGTCMVQKNRDYRGQNLLSIRLFRSGQGKYKILTVNDLWSSGAGAVMNEKGLMIVQNDGNSLMRNEISTRPVSFGSIFLLRYVAENCANLDEAVAMMKKFHRLGIARAASLYLIADLNSGAIIEATARHQSCAEVNFGFEVRANNYVLPGMRSVVMQQRKHFLNGANRRYAASEFLRQVMEKKGKIAPFDLMRLARFRQPEIEQTLKYRSVCNKTSLSSIMFVPDRQFPEYLSAAFVALGPQRHTLFLPVPMGVSAMPESLTNGDWGSVALNLADKLPLDHQYIADFEKVETGFIDEFFAAREQARLLITTGKRDEAVKLLDNLFRRHYSEAKKFMAALHSKVDTSKESTPGK